MRGKSDEKVLKIRIKITKNVDKNTTLWYNISVVKIHVLFKYFN